MANVLDAGLLLLPGLLRLELGRGRHGLLLLELAGLAGLLHGLLLFEMGDEGHLLRMHHPLLEKPALVEKPEFLEKPVARPEFLEKPVTVFLQVLGLCLRGCLQIGDLLATHEAAAGRWLLSGN